MNLILLLITLVCSLVTASLADKRCKGIYFNDRYYNVEILKEGINNIRSLSYNKHDNNVYFIFDRLKGNPTAVGHLNLETKEAGVIEGIREPNAIAVNERDNIVYIGGADGVYRINDKRVPVKLNIDKQNIVSMCYKDVLYFITSKREAYKYVNGQTDLVSELQDTNVDALAEDKDGNIFFLQDNLLLRVKAGTRAFNTHEKYSVFLVTTNSYFDVFVGASDGVYSYDKFKFALRKVADIRDLKGLTFNESNEPIYAVADKIFKLRLSEIGCFED